MGAPEKILSDDASFDEVRKAYLASQRDEVMPFAFAWLEIHDLLPPKRFLPDIAPHMHADVLTRYEYRDLQAGVCPYCTEPMPQKIKPPKKIKPVRHYARKVRIKIRATLRWTVTRDHIHPRADGGPNVVYNIVAAHARCNQAKSDVPLIMYMWGKATGKLSLVRRVHHKRYQPVL